MQPSTNLSRKQPSVGVEPTPSERSSLTIPQRNRAVKALLIRTYGREAGIRVCAGRGTAYHWIEVEFLNAPASLRGAYGDALNQICGLIRANGFHVATYCSDGDYTGDCLSLRIVR